MIKITANHLKAAMRVLDMDTGSFAERCGVGRATISRAVLGEKIKDQTWLIIQTTLEKEGFSITQKGITHPTLFQRH